MRLFETIGSQAIDSLIPRIDAKAPHCNSYNPVMELTNTGARRRVFTYGPPVAIGLRWYGRYIRPQQAALPSFAGHFRIILGSMFPLRAFLFFV